MIKKIFGVLSIIFSIAFGLLAVIRFAGFLTDVFIMFRSVAGKIEMTEYGLGLWTASFPMDFICWLLYLVLVARKKVVKGLNDLNAKS